MTHVPVLENQVLQSLDPRPNENFIDATIGNAGHSLAILKKTGPKGKLLGIDQDRSQIESCKLKTEEFKERVILVCDNFANLKAIVKNNKFLKVDGILFDLGMSSWHLEKSFRGFSFLRNEPLDMRYNGNLQLPKRSAGWEMKANSVGGKLHRLPNSNFQNELTAEKIVNQWPEQEIENILREYGEERFARNIAKKIAEQRKIKPIKTTFELVEAIKKAVPLRYQRRKIHCATRSFQSLRIAANNELNNLKESLPQAIEILSSGGRLAVISFHSLEDRIVKNFLKEQAQKKLINLITKKPIAPLPEEIKINPRSRSAKLRAAVKICLKQTIL